MSELDETTDEDDEDEDEDEDDDDDDDVDDVDDFLRTVVDELDAAWFCEPYILLAGA